jgi:hypothetical protein
LKVDKDFVEDVEDEIKDKSKEGQLEEKQKKKSNFLIQSFVFIFYFLIGGPKLFVGKKRDYIE